MLIKKKEDQGALIYDAACDYKRRGFSVIPLYTDLPEHMAERQELRGKYPIGAWKKYQTELATDAELQEWFYPYDDRNVGLVTGELSGIVVLDIDSEEGYALALKNGLPDTPMAETGRGWHLYYKFKEGARNFQKRADLPGIDLRGEGGYVVAPPSVHKSGVNYQWVEGKGLDDLELAELPDWVLAKAPEEKKPLLQLVPGVPKGSRNESLTRMAGSWVRTMTFDEVNSAALAWNKKCEPPDSEQQVLRTVKSIWEAEHAGLPDNPGAIVWDEPVLFDNVELPRMSSDLLPSYLGEYAGAVSRQVQAPEGIASLLGLSVAATAIQKKVVVSPEEHGDYVEPVNVWTVVVADPSERKSPVLREMMSPVVEWEIEQCDLLKDEKTRVDTERALAENRIKKLHSDAGKAETPDERIALATAINELKDSMPDEVRFPVMWTGNVTTERLEQLMVDHNEKMSVITDEGGIFEIMGGLYNNGKVNLDVFLLGYSGNPTRTDRAGRSAHMKNPLLTLGLAIQPKVLENLSRGSKSSFRGTGLLSRFLYYKCETHRGHRLYANQQPITPEVRRRYSFGLKALLDIPLEYDEFDNAVPRRLHLDDDARALYILFHDEIERMLACGAEFEGAEDWGGKLAGNTLRVAGLFHVVEHGVDTRAINRETLDRAIRLMRVLIPHAMFALNATTTSGLAKDAEHVYRWLLRQEKREFTKRDCHGSMQSRFPNSKDLDAVLTELTDRNIIRPKAMLKTTGRPSSSYETNPAIFIG